jgi:hypothetical protein
MATDYLVPWINSAGGDGSRNSMTVLLGDGATTNWSFNFSGGYINKTDVKAYTYEPTQAVFTAIDLTDPAKWLGPNQIKLTPAVAAGTYLVIYRDTNKAAPLVNFATNSVINEVNLDMMAEQAVYATAEMADRFNAVNASASDATVRSVEALNTANEALDNSTAAQDAAASAVQTSNTANGTANSASSKADTAISTANSARDTANGIDGKAQSALDASAGAVSTANGIDAKAQSALDNSNAAVSTANSASTKADTAISTANTAKSTADGLAASIGTANTNASNAVSTANATSTAMNSLPLGTNLLHNARFQVNQRGKASGTAAAAGYDMSLDRWRIVVSGQAATWAVVNNSYYTVTCPAGGYEQVLEGLDILGGSYYVSWTGTATCEMGAVGSATAVANGSVVTLAAGANIQFRWKSGTLSLPSIVQGTHAQTVQWLTYAQEMHRCQLYWRRVCLDLETYQAPSQNTITTHNFPNMRGAPSVQTLTTPTYGGAVQQPPTVTAQANFVQTTLLATSSGGTLFFVNYHVGLSCDL